MTLGAMRGNFARFQPGIHDHSHSIREFWEVSEKLLSEKVRGEIEVGGGRCGGGSDRGVAIQT